MKRKLIIRYILLGVLLLLVWMTQSIPALGNLYSQTVYPVISRVLSFFSNLFPFAIGDLFIFGSITGVIVYPFYARIRKKLPWKRILLRDGEYLLWVYVWFYLAWGLNYSQPNFYQRTHIPYTAYTPEIFQEFVDNYIDSLNSSFVPVKGIHEEQVRDEAVKLYNQLSDSLGVHRPPFPNPRVKTMVFTPFISMVGVTGSMGPFFCEFTLNGDIRPHDYPAIYAHEFAHLLGIANEGEANFYSYIVCTASSDKAVKFSGYYHIFFHVLRNVFDILGEKEGEKFLKYIRPEIIQLAKSDRNYWLSKRCKVLDAAQDFIFDLYLRGNHVAEGRKSYSGVVGLILAWESRHAK